MNILTQLANHYELDKGTLNPKDLSWYSQYPDHETLGYSEIYETYFDSIKDDDISILEIGIWDKRFPGNSIKMWKEYFTKAFIIGADNFWGTSSTNQTSLAKKMLEDHRTKIEYTDMGNREDWKTFFEKYPSFNFIIDDGSHWPNHIMIALASCFSHVKSGGVYFIEDLQNPISAGHAAYDNLQITNVFQEYISTGNLKRLYITREEHSYLLHTIKDIKIFPRKQNFLVAIEKK